MAETRTYDAALLPQLDPKSLVWSRTWVRSLLRDHPEVRSGVPENAAQPTRPQKEVWPEFSRTDTVIEAALKLDAVAGVVGGVTVTYYRPHFTAARLYLGDPTLWRSRSVDGTTEARRDPVQVVQAWLAQGAAIDALIPLAPLPPFGDLNATPTKLASRIETVVVRTGGGW